ncbi:hypothetical protein AB6D15_23455 [Vibrio splendidus]
MRINQWISKLTPIAVIIGVFSSGSAAASCSTDPLMGSVCVTAAEFCRVDDTCYQVPSP